MKKFAKRFVATILGWQVRRLRKRTEFKVIAIAGSIGKTSTKFAVASALEVGYKVRTQLGNYNDIVSVPLVFFDLAMPSVFNPFAWIITFIKIEILLRRNYPADIVVLEVGTDFPGNIAQFSSFVRADIGILTAITPEHMEFFDNLDAVAKEELEISKISQKLLINADLCDEKYISDINALTYGKNENADYRLQDMKLKDEEYTFTIHKKGKKLFSVSHTCTAESQLISITAAVAAADILGLSEDSIRKGIETIKPVSGRMHKLSGIKKSIILDDTYNSSPEAAKAALDTVYNMNAPQKIALLGNMNELGNYSEMAHKEIGAYCDPEQLDLVVTLGPDSNNYLASEAENAGCKVFRASTPYEAAEKIKEVLKENALILAKGSQNKVFAEESVKLLLNDPADASLLVRQSKYWLKVKTKAF